MVTAGETLAERDCVFLALDVVPYLYSTVVSGKVYKTDSNYRNKSANANILGFVVTGGDADSSVIVRTLGHMEGFSSLTPGDLLIPSTTAGAVTPLIVSYLNFCPVALAVSATKILILPQFGGSFRAIGYTLGGTTTTAAAAVIYCCQFVTNTFYTSTSVLAAALATAIGNQSNKRGYCSAGGATTNQALHFATESMTAYTAFAGAISANQSGSGASSGTKGYTYGRGTYPNKDYVDYVAFSNDTPTSLGQIMTTSKQYQSSASSIAKGYIAGGETADGMANETNIIEATTFSNDTEAALVATLVVTKDRMGGGNSGLKGYWCGGHDPAGTYNAGIEALTFSNETEASVTTELTARAQGTVLSATQACYIVGGANSAGTRLATTEIIDFSTETSLLGGICPTIMQACGTCSA